MSAEHNWEGLFWGHPEQRLQNSLPQPKVFLDGSVVKNPPDNAGDVGLISGQEDPLEEAMATHSSILAWRIPWTEKPGRPQSIGS